MKKTIGFSSLLLAAISFGSFGVWIRLLAKEMSVYQQIVLRNSFAFLFAFFVVFATKQFSKINWSVVKKINLLLYAFLIPLSVIAYNISMLNTKIVIATFSLYIGTILTGWVAGAVVYKEKLNTQKWVSLFLVLGGLVFFAYPFSSSSINLGLVAGIMSGIFDGTANSFRKDLAGKMNKLFLVLLTAIGGMLVSGLMMSYFHQDLQFFSSMSASAWMIGAFFGFILVVINYLLLVGFQNFDLGMGSIVLSLELVFATVFGIIFLKEFPSTKEVLGGLLILGANVVPNINLVLKKKQTLTITTS